jgi:hypothetical protein
MSGMLGLYYAPMNWPIWGSRTSLAEARSCIWDGLAQAQQIFGKSHFEPPDSQRLQEGWGYPRSLNLTARHAGSNLAKLLNFLFCKIQKEWWK